MAIAPFAEIVPTLSKAIQWLTFRSELPITFTHFPALLKKQNSLFVLLCAIQISDALNKATSKTFADLCHRNILTASRRTRKSLGSARATSSMSLFLPRGQRADLRFLTTERAARFPRADGSGGRNVWPSPSALRPGAQSEVIYDVQEELHMRAMF